MLGLRNREESPQVRCPAESLQGVGFSRQVHLFGFNSTREVHLPGTMTSRQVHLGGHFL
jgi:hypothetical protein